MSLSLRISFFFLGSLLTTAIWMLPPLEFDDSGPAKVVAPGPPPDVLPVAPPPADDDADTVVEDEEMVTSS